MSKRLGQILSQGLEKHELNNKSTRNVDLFIEKTSNIVEFLQKKFSNKDINENQISEIFDTIIQILSKKNNPELLKKASIIFIDYLKKELYFKQKSISKVISDKITSNIFLKHYFLDYINEIIYSINNNNIEPGKEFSFILFLYGANDNYDLKAELSSNNISGISRLVQTRVNKINHNSSKEEIEEFCLLIEVVNQLTLIQGINAEDKLIGAKLFNKILIKKTYEAIINFIGSKDKNLLKKLNGLILTEVFFTDIFKSDLSEEELYKLNFLQNIYGKPFENFSANLEYIKNDEKNSGEVLGGKIGYFIDHILYGSLLREKADYGNLKGEKLKEMKRKSSQIRDGNIAFTKLLYIKKLENIKEKTKDQIELINLKNLFLKDLIFIYVNICKSCLKENKLDGNIDNIINEVISHFIKCEKPEYFQLIVIYKLILFTEVGFGELNKIANYLAALKNSPSISFEKFKIKTFELIVQKLTQNLTIICDNLYCEKIDCAHKDKLVICNKIINKIEKYISKNNRESLIFNYGKIYLILSKLYSLGISKDSQEKSKKYYHIFHEKYGNILPTELKAIIEEIKINYARFDLRKYGINNKTISKKGLIYGGDQIINSSKEIFLLAEINRIQDGISKLILKIQNSEFGYLKNSNSNNLEKEICSLLEKELFNNLCKINIVPKGTNFSIGRFDRIEKIENDVFDIVFLYDKAYDSSFQYIFSQKKDFIKNSVIQLIDIFGIYSKIFSTLNTVKGLTSYLMEKKHEYTGGHIVSVCQKSEYIGKVLGYDGIKLQELTIAGIMHDLGKLFIADNILKNPGKLTDEEYAIMQTHSGLGIIEGVKNKFEDSILEGMVHHAFFHNIYGDPNLKYNYLLQKCKEDPDSVSPLDFNKLIGHHIPYKGRIITIGDSIDAISSRRIYEDRAYWRIEKLIKEVDEELLKCSGLIRFNGSIKIDTKIWEKAHGKINTPSFFEYQDGIYIPKEEVIKLQFDPDIISRFVQNKNEYELLKKNIIALDKERLPDKIKEFKLELDRLKTKFINYLNLLKDNDNNIELIPESLRVTDIDKNNIQRLETNLPEIIRIQEEYKKKK